MTVESLKVYVNGPMGRYSTWFAGVFYAGSDDKFDYVVVDRRVEADSFKIRLGELGVRPHMRVQESRKNWVDITEMFSPEPKPK